MTELIAQQELAQTQYADLLEDGSIWIHENSAPAQDIKLDALAATRLYDFLLRYMGRITPHVAAAQEYEDTRKYVEHYYEGGD